MSRKNAEAAGKIAATATGAGLIGATASLTGPAANLGGYVVAQQVAGAIGVGAGPALSGAIAVIGGPVVAGALATAAVGCAFYTLFSLFDD